MEETSTVLEETEAAGPRLWRDVASIDAAVSRTRSELRENCMIDEEVLPERC